jgi:hypothetical protein
VELSRHEGADAASKPFYNGSPTLPKLSLVRGTGPKNLSVGRPGKSHVAARRYGDQLMKDLLITISLCAAFILGYIVKMSESL